MLKQIVTVASFAVFYIYFGVRLVQFLRTGAIWTRRGYVTFDDRPFSAAMALGGALVVVVGGTGFLALLAWGLWLDKVRPDREGRHLAQRYRLDNAQRQSRSGDPT